MESAGRWAWKISTRFTWHTGFGVEVFLVFRAVFALFCPAQLAYVFSSLRQFGALIQVRARFFFQVVAELPDHRLSGGGIA